jgi:hypothetical protein
MVNECSNDCSSPDLSLCGVKFTITRSLAPAYKLPTLYAIIANIRQYLEHVRHLVVHCALIY